MDIIDHGKWLPYKPTKENWPEGAPANALFAKRESDGFDWYQYVNPTKEEREAGREFSSRFRDDSIKIAFMFHETEQQWIIGPAVIDATLIFPANHHVREIVGFGSTDEIEIINAFRNRAIDPATNALSDRKWPDPQPDLFALVLSLQERIEVLEAQITRWFENNPPQRLQ